MKETMNNLKRVYKYGKKYKKNLIIFILISILSIGIDIIFPIITAKQLVALSQSLYTDLIIAALICFGMAMIYDITTVVLNKCSQIFFRGTIKNIQINVADEILKIHLSSIDKNGSGTFIQRIVSDTSRMSMVFTKSIRYITSILAELGVFVAVFIINKVVFCYFLICSILLTVVHLLRVRKTKEEDKECRKQREKTSSLIGELVRGIRDIKMLYAKESFTEEIDRNIDDLTNKNFSLRNIEIKYNYIISVLYDLCELLLIILLAFFMFNNYLSIASALVLYNYRSRIFASLMHNVGNLLNEIKEFNLSCNRVFSILDNNEFKKEVFGKKHIKDINGNIEFKNVQFSYEKQKVLKGMSFKVNANETIAFVGKSGAGKTTIFYLLCKLYNINSGSILLDGNNINTLDEYSIRNNITIISQNPYIFNMSIKDNFKLVKKDVTDKEIKEACKLACIDKFIDSLPDKYETVVGEGGVTLSGGQRQRLAIARAFVQNTKIILFDEATSALDNETQENIQQAIDNMKEKYTILIIAHRLSTIINSDKIMLVDDGKIIDTGTHKELLKNNKMYKKLYEREIL